MRRRADEVLPLKPRARVKAAHDISLTNKKMTTLDAFFNTARQAPVLAHSSVAR